jgi:hypothetical protein
MTIQEYAAAAIEKSAGDLLQAALALPEDKREWKPQEKGRSALSQLAECATMNTLAAKIVSAGAYQESLMAEWGELLATLDTPEKAVTQLREGAAALASAIRKAPDASLENEIRLPWATVTLAQFFLMPFWNMSYHEGQINYIGTLL